MSKVQSTIANEARILKVIEAPHISEKCSLLADANNQYVFKVIPDATKLEIKHAVEYLFKVDVIGVQVNNLKGKQKRFGKFNGRRKDIKKAYVRLKADQSIDFVGKE